MTEQTTLFSRIGNWFKRSDAESRPEGDGGPGVDAAALGAALVNNEDGSPADFVGENSMIGNAAPVEPRSTFLRPWAKRDAAIDNLQNGLDAIGDLMTGIRDHLDKQSRRQDELLGYLSHLPAALEGLPESNRLQGETLKAIRDQMGRQHEQQSKLGDILERISQADTHNGRALDALQSHVEQLRQHDEAIAGNLSNVGGAMENLGKNSAESARVLQQLRDNTASRDGEIKRILQQQGNRFTTLLAVAMFLSISALAAAGVIGYLGLQALQHAK